MRVEVVDQKRTRELRRRVLRPELSAEDPLPGDELGYGVHLGAVAEDDTVRCTCLVYPDPCPWLPERAGAWHLRQMATDPVHQGHGLGSAVLHAAIDHVRVAGASLLWCHARVAAVGFYARHGFLAHGAAFVDARAEPHRHMWLELSAEPFPAPTTS